MREKKFPPSTFSSSTLRRPRRLQPCPAGGKAHQYPGLRRLGYPPPPGNMPRARATSRRRTAKRKTTLLLPLHKPPFSLLLPLRALGGHLGQGGTLPRPFVFFSRGFLRRFPPCRAPLAVGGWPVNGAGLAASAQLRRLLTPTLYPEGPRDEPPGRRSSRRRRRRQGRRQP